jgi:hypothetical protein
LLIVQTNPALPVIVWVEVIPIPMGWYHLRIQNNGLHCKITYQQKLFFSLILFLCYSKRNFVWLSNGRRLNIST